MFVQALKDIQSPGTSLFIGRILFWHSCRQSIAKKIFLLEVQLEKWVSIKWETLLFKMFLWTCAELFDKTASTVSPKFKIDPLRHGKKTFYKFSNKKKYFSSKCSSKHLVLTTLPKFFRQNRILFDHFLKWNEKIYINHFKKIFQNASLDG